jgi:pilus assembly protein FimV
VLKSILKMSGYIACLAWSGMVCATGLGGINVSSNLGQPLKAEIDLVSVDKTDKSSISAKLASAEAFKTAGIDYPYALPKLKFEVINRDSGEPYIKVTSTQPVNEPFVTLLVEVSWSSGKLMREYTFLLDPADFKLQEPKIEAVKPIEPVVAVPATPIVSETTPVLPTPVETVPVSAPAPTGVVESTSPQPVEQPAEKAPAAVEKVEAATSEPTKTEAVKTEAVKTEPVPVSRDALSKEEAIPVIETAPSQLNVVRGDTLTKIAYQTKPAEVSLERMLVALYRANAGAFAGKNMNRLMAGKIIRMPDAAEMEAVQQREAVKEIHAQVVDWNAYRQQLAAVRTEAGSQTGRQESSGKVSTAVTEKVPAIKEPSKEVLKLSKGEAPSDKAVGVGKTTPQDKKNAQEEEVIAKNKALKDAQERTALLEKNVKDLQKLAELKKPAVAAGQTPAVPAIVASAPVAVTAIAAASSVASAVPAASAPKVASPKVVLPPKVVVAQTSLLDDVLADPVMLAGGAVLVLGLGGIGYVLVRRRKKTGKVVKAKSETGKQEDAGSGTGRITSPVIPSPDTGDFTQSAHVEQPVQSNVEEVDPIGEADLFLTFGRDVQAEEVLKEALKTNPANVPVRLKLLSIYANRKDKNAFFTNAREIKDSGDEASWQEAAAMGRELEPDNTFYGGDGSSSVKAPQKTDSAQPSVDFDLGFGSTGATSAAATDHQKTVKLEAPSLESTAILSNEELHSAQSTPMDFDVTGSRADTPSANIANPNEMDFDITASNSKTTAAPPETETPNANDLIFDITSTHPGVPPAVSAKAKAAPAAEDSSPFTLDFPSEFNAPPAHKNDDIGLADISLNMGGVNSNPASSSNGIKDEQWQEVATKLDLAKAYQEMGDSAGAKEILDEVLRDGDEPQRASAQAMLKQL